MPSNKSVPARKSDKLGESKICAEESRSKEARGGDAQEGRKGRETCSGEVAAEDFPEGGPGSRAYRGNPQHPRRYLPQCRVRLHHRNAWELLVATILSAQCTDVRVNMVTPALFRGFPRPPTLRQRLLRKSRTEIRSTGFYHNKAKSISGAAKQLIASFMARSRARWTSCSLFPALLARPPTWFWEWPTRRQWASSSIPTSCAYPSASASPATPRPKKWSRI